MPVIGFPTQTQIREQIRNGLRFLPEDVVKWPLILQQFIAIESQKRYDDLGQQAVQLIPVIGGALRRVKASLSHGEWLVWCKTDYQRSDRTAQLYMQCEADWALVTAAGVDKKPGASLRSIRKFIIQAQKAAQEAANGDQEAENARNGPKGSDKPGPDLSLRPDGKKPLDLYLSNKRFGTWTEDLNLVREVFGQGQEGDGIADIVHEWVVNRRAAESPGEDT